MTQELPKLDREEFRRRMREAFERTMDQVVDAVDAAPCGRIIRDSEEKARDVLEEFRRVAFETAIQMKINAAEAAFPPSEERGDRKADAQQGSTTDACANRERPPTAATNALARRGQQKPG
jgi:hypothetical protein